MTPTHGPAAADAAAELAGRLTAYAVLAHDPAVPQIAADYWAKSEDHYRAVDAALAALVTGSPAASAYAAVTGSPTHVPAQRDLRAFLTTLLRQRPDQAADSARVVAGADERIWIDYHLGTDYLSDNPQVPDFPEHSEPSKPAESPASPDPAGAPAHIVIPFRDREGGLRTRNLLACLRALADQADGPAHRVTVVETDVEPRTREAVAGLVDDYVFAHKDGLFNKAWAVNVGVMSAPGDPRYTCVLDADILVDRHFVARNTARLRDGAHGSHLPFRWSLSLDEPSTLRALALRVGAGAAEVPGSVLRGLLLREPPGGCVWLRTGLFHTVGGFDERFEGWGGEDDDVVARLSAAAPLVRFDDDLLHLNHPRPEMTREDGQPFNAHLQPMVRTAAHAYGDPRKFSLGPA
ncbi:galactosyltransferase-related protein [Streptomyces sp. JB150]|uniref:glycosyltransferase n=1 Tax=Streptomyces sp. JB150 TaxID=2714844 RepID=UPI0014097AD6|nr:galactosyltransferase-related protein [Streptomyces sp. JB150]QIJ66057.1 glycosyltransferase [Streptomyces sp. JB150]